MARLPEPEVVRELRERLDAAVERLELERFVPDELLPPALELLLLFERALDERFAESAMEAFLFSGVVQALPAAPARHASFAGVGGDCHTGSARDKGPAK